MIRLIQLVVLEVLLFQNGLTNQILIRRKEPQFRNKSSQNDLKNTQLGQRILEPVYACREGWNCYYGQCKNQVCQCQKGYQGSRCNDRDSDSDSSSTSDPWTWIAGVIVCSFFGIIITVICICCRSIKPKANEQGNNQLEESDIQNNSRHGVLKIQSSQQKFKPWKLKINQVRPAESEKLAEIQNCSICLDDIAIQQEYELNCPSKHVFHKQCIKQWVLIHRTCPQCRAEIS